MKSLYLFAIVSIIIISCKKDLSNTDSIIAANNANIDLVENDIPMVITNSNISLSIANARTGELIRYNYSFMENQNEFFTQTPVVVNNAYIFFTANAVISVNPDTKEINWKTSIDNKSRNIYRFVTSYPCIKGDKIYFMHANFRQAHYGYQFYAMNINNGNIKWSKELVSTGYAVKPSAPTIAGDNVLVPVNDTLYTFDINTGEEKWKYSNKSYYKIYNPFVNNGKVYLVHSGNNSFEKKDSLVALDMNNGQVLWNKAVKTVGANPAVIGDNEKIYLNMQDGVMCVNANTGKDIWKFNSSVYNVYNICPVDFADGKVFATDQRSVFALDANTGAKLWPEILPESLSGTLNTLEGVVAMNDIIYFRYGGHIMRAFNAENGNLVWETDMHNINVTNPDFSPTILNGSGKTFYYPASGMH